MAIFDLYFMLLSPEKIKVWFMDFLLTWCFLSGLKSKIRVSVPKVSIILDWKKKSESPAQTKHFELSQTLDSCRELRLMNCKNDLWTSFFPYMIYRLLKLEFSQKKKYTICQEFWYEYFSFFIMGDRPANLHNPRKILQKSLFISKFLLNIVWKPFIRAENSKLSSAWTFTDIAAVLNYISSGT